MNDPDILELKKMVAQSLAYSKEAALGVRGLKRQVWLTRLWGLVKIMLIILPLLWGYLFFSEKFQQLKQNLGVAPTGQTNYLKQAQDLLKQMLPELDEYFDKNK